MASKLHFLGTGCMAPTKDRHHLSVALEYNGNIFLFDCGEATQNRIKEMKLPHGKIKKIFISHWHGDHVLGLLGLVQTLSNVDVIEKIEIHGPKDSKKYFDHMMKSTVFDTDKPIEVFEHEPKEGELKKVLAGSGFEIVCAKLNHSVPCIGYRFIERDTYNIDMDKLKAVAPELEKNVLLARAKMGLDIDFEGKVIKADDITYKKNGLNVSFVFDTRPCQGAKLLAENVDYLVMESTFSYKKHFARAEEYDHMSARETAEIAAQCGVKNLLITHFSQRYKDITEIEEEAKEYFENTTATEDLMTVNLRK